jgi:23S rRNA (cytidine1920-2'-O)/16S rRNA (cytidine1409-2'-O)-methyltransferase
VARERLDRVMVDRGLAESRERAQALIMAGSVAVDGQPARRAAMPIDDAAEIAVKARMPYVSRGGLKLAHAIEHFGLDVAGLTMADVGASTGGFTDCLLQRGAARVYAIDVGYGQLDWRLRQDPRVVVMERTHAREVAALPEPIDAAVVDVSFISLRQVLPNVFGWLAPGGWVVALIKPQFEAGREQVGKGGVVRDPAVHDEVILRVTHAVEALGKRVAGVTPSPILGPAGNREFLVHVC